MNCGSLYVGYDSAGILSLSGSSTVKGTVVLGNMAGSTGVLNIADNSSVSSLSAAVAAGSAGTLNVAANAQIQTPFSISVGAGTFTLNNSGALSVSYLNTSGGTVIVNNLSGGSLAVNATISNLTNAGSLSFSGYNYNGGGLNIQGQIVNSGLMQSAGSSTTNSLWVPANQTATLTGSGQVLLNGGYINYMYNGTAGTLTNQDNLIHGWGYIQ